MTSIGKTLVRGGMLLFSLASVSFLFAGDDVLTKLNVAPAAAKGGILEALTSGTVYNEAGMKVFKTLPAASRAAIVNAGLGWIKAYVGSGEFAAAYKKLREKEKPEPPAPPPSADEQTKKMKADIEKSIAETRKNMAVMDAVTKKAMEASIQEMRALMERMEKDPQQKELMRQMAEMTVAEDKKRHEEKLKEWEQLYPADFRVLIKKRINDFLSVSAGVDFATKLAPRGELMVFANEDYEQKPPEWKLCYRAGKEATAAARAFAKSWLAELDEN